MKSIAKWMAVTLISGSAFMVTAQASDVGLKERQSIENALKPLLNGPVGTLDIQSTPINNLYQVKLGFDIIYVSGDGNYLMQGQMMDLQTGVNMTAAAVNGDRKAIIDSIPESSMVVYPSDKNAPKQSTITVFTDIDCPYCRKFHKEIPALNKAGVTVRYLAFPRSGPNTDSYFKAVSAWCAEKPAETLDKLMNGAEVDKKSCQNPVNQHMQYVRELEINGTPNIILEDGALLPGYVESQKLIPRIYN
ncbi:DsbC family protein [Thiomicrorhabdus sp. 6S2-11]|jgi:thiol:disulfide interchange protein DsbC|uniref:Thiol:disulfide interchange protein n=1 Tax=Thiomicrorhabdus marina TaxID=2818442 RepID=A0ABS3Q2T8_9GAMM|nr:DsbC family protein [Thiomicrorhabdus marina]MBO1926259.1 DsbC family protein [Thiomicrorhabdus marina]